MFSVQQASSMGATAPSSVATVPMLQSDVQAAAAPGATESLQIMAAALASVQRRYITAFAYVLICFDNATQLAMLFCCSVLVSIQG